MGHFFRRGVWALWSCLLAMPAAGAVFESESQDWRELAAQAWAAPPGDALLEMLTQFLNAHPSGAHAVDARFAVAESLFAQQRYEEAATYYRAFAQQPGGPYFEDALLRLGELAYNCQRYEEAERSWGQAARLISRRSPLLAETWYGLALCRLRRQDYLGADRLLGRLLAKFPAYARADQVRELHGLLGHHAKRLAEAVRILEGVETPTAAFYTGLSLHDQNRFLEAAGAFDKLARLAGGPEGELGAFFKAECFRKARQEVLAAAAYGEMLQKYPDGALAGYARAQRAALLLQAPAGDRGEARRLLDEVRRSAAADEPSLGLQLDLIRAYDLIAQDHWGEAAALLGAPARAAAYPHLGMLAAVVAGEEAALRGDWAAAISGAQKALLNYAYTPFSDVALSLMLTSYFQAGQYQDLATDANRILRAVMSSFSNQNILWRAYSHFIMAESYYRLGNYAAAAQNYQQAQAAPALALQARLYQAWALYRQRQYGPARKLARAVAASGEAPEPSRASAAFLEAGSRFDRGDYGAALEGFAIFRRDYPRDPHVPETWLQEGRAFWELGDAERALSAWTSLAGLFPDHPLAQEALLGAGQAYFQARQYDQAGEIFADFLKRWPDSPRVAQAQWALAQCRYNQEDFAQAVQEYQAFALKYPQDPRAAEAAGQRMIASFRQAEKSQDAEQLARFVSDFPSSAQAPEAQYQLAHLHFTNGRWPQAVAAFHKLLLDYPQAVRAQTGLIELAEAEEHLDDLAAARRDYQSLLRLLPESPLAGSIAMRLGAAHFKSGHFADAAESFRLVMTLAVSSSAKADAGYNLAAALKAGRDYDAALRAWNDFAGSHPEDPRRLEARLETASIYEATKRSGRAAAAYEAILREEPLSSEKKAALYKRLGDLALEGGDQRKALEAYSRLIALRPSAADARLAGLAQLAALYEEKSYWRNALMIYREIERSGGRAEWVEAAAKRGREIAGHLTAQRPASGSTGE